MAKKRVDVVTDDVKGLELRGDLECAHRGPCAGLQLASFRKFDFHRFSVSRLSAPIRPAHPPQALVEAGGRIMMWSSWHGRRRRTWSGGVVRLRPRVRRDERAGLGAEMGSEALS